MSVAVAGSGVGTAYQAITAGTPDTVNLPASITSGELLILPILSADTLKNYSATGWTQDQLKDYATDRILLLLRTADGTEGSTVSVSIDAGSSGITCVAARLSGVDTADPTPNSNNSASGTTANSATITIAANTLTGVTSGNAILVVLACEAVRHATVVDADLTTIYQEYTATSSILVFIEPVVTAGGNAQYDFTLDSARAMDYALFEIKASATGGGFLTRNYWWDSY